MQRVYSLLVDNNPGVLSRISGLFSRRGYSIDSITAGVTADPRFTRITIVASGDELILSQIEKQVRKLEDVIEIKVLDPADSVYRELIMAKIRALNGIAAGRGQTLAEMAIAWLLGRPGVTSALIGASRPEQIRDVVAGLRNLDFTAEELAGIERILG